MENSEIVETLFKGYIDSIDKSKGGMQNLGVILGSVLKEIIFIIILLEIQTKGKL